MKEIDCRGMACPQPVVTAKKALDESEGKEFTLIVDNAAARDNVGRFVRSQGCTAEIKERGQDFYIHVQKTGEKEVERTTPSEGKGKRIVVYINSHLLGNGDEALGAFLMKAFLKTLLDVGTQPKRLILVNSGVLLAAEDSKVLESLRGLAEKGVEIVCCGTCVDFYELKGKTKVGIISNMYDIVQSMIEADGVIKP